MKVRSQLETTTSGGNKESIMFKLENISFEYPLNPGVRVLENISLEIQKGDTFVITGGLASGKTTLLNILLGHIKPVSGKVTVDYKKNDISFLMQNVYDSFIGDTVYDDLLFSAKGMEVESFKNKMQAWFLRFKLKDSLLRRNPKDLSTGEARLIRFIDMMVLDKDVLFFDDPLAGLDRDRKDMVRTVLKELSEDETKTVVIVSGDEWLKGLGDEYEVL